MQGYHSLDAAFQGRQMTLETFRYQPLINVINALQDKLALVMGRLTGQDRCHCNWILKLLVAKLNVSPLPTVLFAVKSPYHRRFPDELASNTPTPVIVPHEAVAVAKVNATPLLVAVLTPAPVTVGKLVVLHVTEYLAYEPPDTSVPPPAIPGVVVNRPM
jgi:hypothetical protein